MIAHRTGSATGIVASRLEWLDRTGRTLEEIGTPATYWSPALSPDVQRLAVHREEETRDIWIFDLGSGTSSRFTFDPGNDDDPVWSPSGNRIVFGSSRAGRFGLHVKSAAAGQERLLLETSSRAVPMDWSRDGNDLLFGQSDPATSQDIWVLPLAGDRTPKPIIQTLATERMARFSPDGRWVAYVSNESGGFEVYVETFPVTGRKWRISTSSGVQPMWRGDGRELFYLSLAGEVMAVPVTPTNTRRFEGLEVGTPQKLFSARPTALVGARNAWSVAPDGQRFLIANAAGGANVAPITVVVNWTVGVSE